MDTPLPIIYLSIFLVMFIVMAVNETSGLGIILDE